MTTQTNPHELLQSTQRLSRDLAQATGTLTRAEARFLVSNYYRMQENRIRTAHQTRTLNTEPHATLEWLYTQNQTLENQIKRALKHYADAHPIGEWMQTITGIGPVISAGLIAHIDIEICNTASRIWRYAGLDPTVKWPNTQQITNHLNENNITFPTPITTITKLAADFGRNPELLTQKTQELYPWTITRKQAIQLLEQHTTPNQVQQALTTLDKTHEKTITKLTRDHLQEVATLLHLNPTHILQQAIEQHPYTLTKTQVVNLLKRLPWNAELKTLTTYKLGESFVKVQNHPDDIYGKLYASKKTWYQQQNEAGKYEELALARAETVGKNTEAYKHYSKGKLPPAHIHARARRYAVKIFLSHLHHVWYEMHFGTEPPAPFAIAHLGHTDYIPPPNW